MAAARIAQAIVRDEGAVMPVGCYQSRYGVTLSLPAVVGRNGVSRSLEPVMSEPEKQRLQQSADKLREAVARISS
jgi:L-lactate dehydrogenase